ncbi:MAG: DUF4012 domain-containing protein [bacterium]|nr:DUF4012 domain-containing protein [bacterium]
MGYKNILSQMFDVKPVDQAGNLDLEKIKKIEKILTLESRKLEREIQQDIRQDIRVNSELYRELERLRAYEREMEAKVFCMGDKFKSSTFPIFHKSSLIPRRASNKCHPDPAFAGEGSRTKNSYNNTGIPLRQLADRNDNLESKRRNPHPFKSKHTFFWNANKKTKDEFKFRDLFIPARFAFDFKPRKTALYFVGLSLIIAIIIGGFTLGAKGMKIKGEVLGTSQDGYSNLNSAVQSIQSQNYTASGLEFGKAYEKFSEASQNIDQMGKTIIEISQFFPISSKLSSGKNLVEAGKHISLVGQSLNMILKETGAIQNPSGNNEENTISLLELFKSTEKEVKIVNDELQKTTENINNVNVDDLPEDKREEFISLKNNLPSITNLTKEFLNNSEIFTDLLGGNGPRKYLFLFQNNQEMRATGGFIGSYGLLDINNGRIRNFFIDGIFNPDGQLQEKIIPPTPIQKVSAAWSLHDSNWFPDFPTSAKEAMAFYEKTGGPTVDGVITLTPEVMKKLLEVTGPIEMKDYGIIIDADNFIEKTQQEVEISYDKEENKPKKILSDLAPLVLDKIFNARDITSVSKTFEALSGGLSEKHILLYSQDEDLQKIISREGWSGEILKTSKDYFSVINTNINGYKTDGVVSEEINHSAEIQSSGEIIDTVTVTRHHNGGNSEFEWQNKVNADYLRVYVPLGSKLLEAEGQTRETNNPPLDYQALGFKKDPLIQKEEENMATDEASGTKIYEDSGKTVFANWTYVSPQETMTLKYKYILPFKIDLSDSQKPADSYSLLTQKQSGSLGSKFSSSVKFPQNYDVIWNYPDNLGKKSGAVNLDADLKLDKFIGLVFTKNNVIVND